MGNPTGAGRRLMSGLQVALRRGLALLLAFSAVLAFAAGEGGTSASDPDAALNAVFKDIEQSRLNPALEKLDALITAWGIEHDEADAGDTDPSLAPVPPPDGSDGGDGGSDTASVPSHAR